MPSQSHQLDTFRIYGELIDVRKDWSGGLVLCCGEGSVSNGTSAAVSIAGGATLAIDPDAAAVKAAMRLGRLDFVVNTLDEALRTLKNEIRQHRPLSVGLISELGPTLSEMANRGVLPDLLLIGPNQSARAIRQNDSIRTLETQGMLLRLMVKQNEESAAEPTIILSGRNYYEVYLPTANAAELRTLDERLLAILPPDDVVRRHWIQRGPQYVREARTGGRWIWLTEEEQRQFAD